MKRYHFIAAYNVARLACLKLRRRSLSTPLVQLISPTTRLVFAKGARAGLGARLIIERHGDVFVQSGARLEIGRGCYFNTGLTLSCQEKISIGERCVCGPNVKIYDNNHRFSKKDGVMGDKYKTSPISIGAGCWIGANAVILKGTVIGEHCVIGAGCVVQGKIPPGSIVTSRRELVIQKMEDR